jgi:hypothetical protein
VRFQKINKVIKGISISDGTGVKKPMGNNERNTQD